MMNETLVKYLAGLLDADGSLSFTFKQDTLRSDRYYLGLTVSLASSDAVDRLGFVDDLPFLTGMGVINRYGKNQQFKAWKISKRSDLEMLLPRVIKHMIIKAQHWNWLLHVWREQRTHNKTCSLVERDELTQQSKESRRSRVGPLHAKNHPTWAWVSGYLDGDGWYSYRSYSVKGSQQWTIMCGAVAHVNDRVALDLLQRAFGGAIAPQGQSENVLIWRRSLGYQNRSFALRFLPKLAKHSRLKREKIDAIIHHHQQRLSVPGTKKKFCGCGREAHGHGLCQKHYLQIYRDKQNEVQATV